VEGIINNVLLLLLLFFALTRHDEI